MRFQEGIQRVGRFIFSESFVIEKAIIAAAKAAYLSRLIKGNNTTIEKYNDPLVMKDWSIVDAPFNKLNKLKKSIPEAFFYWYQCLEILDK